MAGSVAEGRPFLSIGDVLALLKEDFPDITISKIRFLESQGLLDPERTPSGYRKFYDEDVERLRWILRQQRENFLPLKVIKGRLEGRIEPDPAQGQLDLETSAVTSSSSPVSLAAGLGSVATVTAARDTYRSPLPVAVPSASAITAAPSPPAAIAPASVTPAPSPPAAIAPASVTPAPSPPAAIAPASVTPADDGLQLAREALGLSAPRSGGSPRAARTALGLDKPDPEPELAPAEEGGSMTAAEVAAAAGLPEATFDELVRYGLLSSRSVAGTDYFDEDALAVARLAAGFYRFGIEPRHIRIYRLAAEREVGLFEQVIVPILKQRNPEARKHARQTLNELSKLGQQMRTAMVRAVLQGLDKP